MGPLRLARTILALALLAGACDSGETTRPTGSATTLDAPASTAAVTVTTVDEPTTSLGPPPTIVSVTLPPGLPWVPTWPRRNPPETLAIGEAVPFTFATGCGYPKFINDTWWMPTVLNFTHPNYPAHWTVEILDAGPVDGPTAIIYGTTLALVSEDRIEIRLVEGDLVAVYAPSEPPGLCG